MVFNITLQKIWNGNHLDFTFKNKESFHKIIGTKGNNDLNKFLLKKIKKNFNQQITNINQIGINTD